jgi:hypothetical protein
MLGTTEWLHKLWPLERYSAPQSWLVSSFTSFLLDSFSISFSSTWLIIPIIIGQEQNILDASLCIFVQHPVAWFLLDLNNLINTLLSAYRLLWGCQPYAPTALYSAEICSVFDVYFYQMLCELQDLLRLEGLGKLKTKLIRLIRFWNRYLPDCSIVPQSAIGLPSPDVIWRGTIHIFIAYITGTLKCGYSINEICHEYLCYDSLCLRRL